MAGQYAGGGHQAFGQFIEPGALIGGGFLKGEAILALQPLRHAIRQPTIMIAADGGDISVHQQARCLPRPAHAGCAIAKADDVGDAAPRDIIQSRFQSGEIAMDIGNHRKAHGLGFLVLRRQDGMGQPALEGAPHEAFNLGD